MPSEVRTLPIISMVFFQVAVSLGSLVASLDPRPEVFSIKIAVIHFSCVLLTGALLIPVLRWSRVAGAAQLRRARRILAVIITTAALLSLLTHWDLLDGLLSSWLPVVSVSVFWPLICLSFFSSQSAKRLGLALALAMGTGEMVWVASQPFAGFLAAGLLGPEHVGHLHKLQGISIAIMGWALAADFVGTGAGGAAKALAQEAGGALRAPACAARLPRSSKAVLGLLFIAGPLFFLLFGLGFGLAFPRAQPRISVPHDIHLLTMIFLPLAGFFMDKGRFGMRFLVCAIIGAAFLVPLTAASGGLLGAVSSMPGALLFLGRQSMFLLVYVLLARVCVDRPYFPFLCALVHSFLMLQAPGAVLAVMFGEAMPMVAVLLALICAACTIRILRLEEARAAELFVPAAQSAQAAHSGRAALPFPAVVQPESHGPHSLSPLPDSYSPAPGALAPEADEPDREKLLLFAAVFSLTNRETEVLHGLLQGLEPDEMAKTLNITARTVRFHTTGILRKTSTRSRRVLMQLFTTWNSETVRPPQGTVARQ